MTKSDCTIECENVKGMSLCYFLAIIDAKYQWSQGQRSNSKKMNIPAFDGSFMLDDFAEITKTFDPFWLGIHRDNVEGWMQMEYFYTNLCLNF